jgi:pectinesterase
MNNHYFPTMKLFFVLLLSVITLSYTNVFAAPDKASQTYDFIVSKDGKGNFKTIQEAIMAIPDCRKATTRILIKNGVYKEKLVLPESKQNVLFIGESQHVTITYDDFATRKNRFGEEIGTSGSAGFYIYGIDIRFENITFSNTAGPVGQAVAVRVAGDKVQFVNCRFLGFQDTLYTYGMQSRQYYLHCYIEGTVDFIFGSSTAVFDSCTIYGKSNGFFTAASTLQNTDYGYVFRYCKLTGSGANGSFKLGRPWRPYAKTVFLQCNMDAIVDAAGWDNWDNKDNEKTAFYAEYKSTGKGSSGTTKRVSWAKELTDEEASVYTLKNIFKDWDPSGS